MCIEFVKITSTQYFRGIFIALNLFTVVALYAQMSLSGTVKDGETGNGLPYATILAGDKVSSTDPEGKFTLELSEAAHITVSYVGYEEWHGEVENVEQDLDLGEIILWPSSEELNTVTITSGKFRQRIQDVTVAMEILKPAVIEQYHVSAFGELLNRIPGVTNLDGQVNIRGGAGYSYGAGSRVMLLLDNLPALQSDAAYPNWSDIPVENIAQVEVLKGAGSALYGSAAMNGVINILTKYATREARFNLTTQWTGYLAPADPQKKWWDEMPMKYHTSAAFSKKFGPISLVSSAYLTRENSYQKDSYNNFGRLHAKIDYPIRDHLISGLALNLNQGQSNSFFYWLNDGAGAYLADTSNYSNNQKLRFTIDPYLNYYGKNNLTHRIQGRYYRVNNQSDNDQSNYSSSFYAEYQLQKKWENLATVLTSGLVGQYVLVEAPLYGDTSFISRNQAIYIQAEKKFFKRLTVNLGGRWEANKIVGPSVIAGKPVVQSETESRPVFRAGMNFQLFPFSNVRASWGQGYRYPSIAEKYISTTAGVLRIVPNPTLHSESGWTAEIGFRQGFRISTLQGFLDMSLFRSEYRDMMEFNILWGVFPIQFAAQNIGNTLIDGFEVTGGLTGDIGPVSISLGGGYVYIDPRYSNFNDTIRLLSTSDENVLKYRNRHSYKMDLEIGFGPFSLGFGNFFLSPMEAIDAAFENFIPGVKNFRAGHTEGTQLYYASLGFKASVHWRISARIDNLFNEEYTLRPARLEAPRHISLRVTYSL